MPPHATQCDRRNRHLLSRFPSLHEHEQGRLTTVSGLLVAVRMGVPDLVLAELMSYKARKVFLAIFFVHIILRRFNSLPPPLPASPDRSPDKLGIKELVPKIAAKSIKWHLMSYLKNTAILSFSVK